jgi:hypothetical protein
MTTPVDVFRGIEWITVVATINDREALQVMHRLTAAQRISLEAQVAQLKQVEEAIEARVRTLGGARGGG